MSPPALIASMFVAAVVGYLIGTIVADHEEVVELDLDKPGEALEPFFVSVTKDDGRILALDNDGHIWLAPEDLLDGHWRMLRLAFTRTTQASAAPAAAESPR